MIIGEDSSKRCAHLGYHAQTGATVDIGPVCASQDKVRGFSTGSPTMGVHDATSKRLLMGLPSPTRGVQDPRR